MCGNQALLHFAISCIGSDIRVGFGFNKPVKTPQKAVEGAKTKLECIQVFNIELWRESLAQIFLPTLAEVALLSVVGVRPESFYLNKHSMKICDSRKRI